MLKFLIGHNDYGKQKYLKESIDYSDQMNTVILDMPTIEELIDQCITPAIMANTKVVVVWSDKELDWKAFAEFSPNLPIDTSLYMCIQELPKDFSSQYKPMATVFKTIETDKELKSYLKNRSSSIGVEFSDKAQDTFFALAGQSELDIDNWLQYLKDIYPNEKIGVEEVRSNVPKVREITPYNIIEYMTKGQVEYTMYLLENYIANGGDMLALNNILIWKCRQWLIIYWALERQKIKRREVAGILDMKTFIATILARESQKFGDALSGYFLELGQALNELKYENNSFRLKDIILRMSLQAKN